MNEELRKLSKEIWGKEMEKYVLNTDAMLYIQNLKKENEQLKKQKEELEKCLKEIEEYIETSNYFKDNTVKTIIFKDYSKYILDKINELEKRNDDEV